VQHLGCGDLTSEHSVQTQGLLEVRLRKAELVAVGVEDPAIREKSRFVQVVTSAAEERKGAPAVVQSLVEATHADVSEGTLHEDLAAHFPGRPRGGAIELGQRCLGVAALQQNENQAQARLHRTNTQVPRFSDGDRSPQAPPRCAQPSGLTSDQTDGTLGNRGGFRLDMTVGEHLQGGGLGLQWVVGNCSQGSFGSIE
jgi:hypothetical protein